MKILTWNSQGDKTTALRKLLSDFKPDIAFVEEMGKQNEELEMEIKDCERYTIEYTGLSGTNPNAENLRCTTGILVRPGINYYPVESEGLGYFKKEISNRCDRPPMAIELETVEGYPLVLIAMHCIANQKAAREQILELGECVHQFAGDETLWIIGGDLNQDPERLQKEIDDDESLGVFTVLYPRDEEGCRISTHMRGGTLDFFITNIDGNFKVRCQTEFTDSDHVAVYLENPDMNL